ncbi:hypothetical protein [Paraburkholderia sartisoli]|uniref:hypothetical protein n=1 Tax=Paraburkholderia sartisoli TaxID=83784 RepID=UPI001FE0E550|nr:hypothetical protein [Paraburkholderia sartisoli]
MAASPNSRTRRAGSAQRRETTVSTETENKLARAARSAQRLAQLSDVPRDDSTFDLFPDDPTRATLEAMTIDVRQGTLTGFELPAEVQAAVGITDDGDALAGESKPTRRVTRAAKIDEAASLSKQASVLDERVEPSTGDAAVETTAPASGIVASAQGVHAGSHAGASAVAEVAALTTSADADSQTSVPAEAANPTHNASAKRTGGSADAAAAAKSAAATPAVSGQPAEARVTAPVIPAAPSASSAGLRQAVAARANETASASQPGASSPRVASTVAKVASAPRDANTSGENAASSDVATSTAGAPRTSSPGFGAPARPTPAGAASRSFGTPQTSSATNTAAPELDRARATAFADTVDALYGVIADQRRAATDHSRRMKWMLSIVVAALLVTVAIGITQTLLLMRLTRDSTAQQQRIEQMMLNQQATLSTLLDTDSATVSAPAIVPVAPAAPAPDAATKHPAVTRHAHKAKTKPAR